MTKSKSTVKGSASLKAAERGGQHQQPSHHKMLDTGSDYSLPFSELCTNWNRFQEECKAQYLFSTELNMLNYTFTFDFMSSTYMQVVDFGHCFSPESTLRLIRESTYTRVYTVHRCTEVSWKTKGRWWKMSLESPLRNEKKTKETASIT